MMKNFSLLLMIWMGFLMTACSEKKEQTVIRGHIPNLPDGMLYIYQDDSSNRIDSVKTVNGNFTVAHQWKPGSEPAYIGIDHIDQKGVLRALNFPTDAKYKNGTWLSQYFMNDPLIAINGEIKDFEVKNIQLSEKYKLVTSPEIKAGKQTEALFNTDADLFETISPKTVQTIKEKIAGYPDSYHLLIKINENRNSFSAQQVDDFLKSFKGETTHGEIYKKLQAYNRKRFNEEKISLPLLKDPSGTKREIADKKYKKHLIIFWASWCGPCRREIPMLKKMYTLYGKEVEFISISTDTQHTSWQKALKEEQMSWKQLIVNNNAADNEALQIRFKLNQAIPYTVLVDHNFKIISSSTGLSDEKELEQLIKK